MSNAMILIFSAGRLGLINSDGANEHYLELNVPNQVGWGAGPAFSDGQAHHTQQL